MATDATGTPTPLGIPKYNTAVDAPSGLGFNAAMDSIDSIISSSTLGATVSATVAGLGAAVNGKVGLIRAGSSPFDFVHLIYDSTYGKWVSPHERSGISSSTSGVINTGTGYATVSSTDNNVGTYGVYATAGLGMQVKAMVTLQTTAADGTIGWVIVLGTFTTGNFTGFASVQTAEQTVAGTTMGLNSSYVMGCSWISLTPTNNTFFEQSLQIRKVGGTGGVKLMGFDGAMMRRWVG